MEKKIYTIGFFTSDYNRGLVSVVLNSLMQYASEFDNLRIRVFDCFGLSDVKKGYHLAGEIYELPDLRDFDGVVVQSHQILSESALKLLGTRIREKNIPAVSIGDFMEGCTRINTDDYSAFRSITEHLIEKHGASSFLFIRGKEREDDSEAEAAARRRGFEDVCREYGIPEAHISYADGAWMNADGRLAAKALLESGRPLPDAIVSANDEMALGCMGVLQEAGIRVPEDVIITGYDDTFGASLSNPRLTTVRRDFETLVRTAMETLRRKIKYNEELPERIYSPFQSIFSGSCGCHVNAGDELATLKHSYYRHNRELIRFYNRQDKMTSELYFSDTPAELLDVLEKNAEIFGGGELFLCANDFYHDSLFEGTDMSEQKTERSDKYSDRFLLTACSRGEGAEQDRSHVYHSFKREDLMQVPFWKDEPFLIFYPLHFENLLMGFIVLTQPPTASDLNFHEILLHLFEFAVENARQQIITTKLNKRLDELYITDPLTGLYNRFGYERLSGEIFGRIKEKGHAVQVFFIDIDNMKRINDRYGHDSGDRAIIAAARVIRESCRASDFKMRFGGDEFIVITEAGTFDFRRRIDERLRTLNDSKTMPFELSLSVGEYIGAADSPETPDELMGQADRAMYLVKQRKKESLNQ